MGIQEIEGHEKKKLTSIPQETEESYGFLSQPPLEGEVSE
jgi:hypothetical protein